LYSDFLNKRFRMLVENKEKESEELINNIPYSRE
jgi:hypothetical protein